MRKLFSQCGSSLSKAFMTLAMLVASVIMAQAADPIPLTEVNQVMEAGVKYSFGEFAKVSGMYNVPATGTLRVDGFEGGIYAKCIVPGSQYSDEYPFTSVDPTGKVREIQVKEGDTVYLFSDFTFNAGVVTIYMEGVNKPALEIQYMQPNPGQQVDFTNYTFLQATFNQTVTYTSDNAVISFQNHLTNTPAELTARISGKGTQMISVPMYSVLKPYIASGAILPGDTFTVTISTLVSNEGEPYIDADANGNIVFTFRCGNIPTVVDRSYCPDPFLSYWPAGTPEGILELVFNGPLGSSKAAYATLGWGNLEGEDGEFYYETLPVKIDGNKATVDFTGKLRTPATMTPLYPNASYPQISINVVGLEDSTGSPVSGDAGTTGSFSFAPQYKVLERGTLAAEFEPANGADLSLASNVNVWISGIKSISFDGFKVDWTHKTTGVEASAVIPMSAVTVTPDGTDASEYDFALPQEILDNAGTATITLNNVVGLDGYDHTGDVRVTYGGFVITYSDPANGAELAMINEGDFFTIETNISDRYPEMYIEYQIVDTDPEDPDEAIVKSTTWMTRNADGSYSAEIYGNYKLLYGKEYHVEFTAWLDEATRNITPEETLGSDFIILRGLTPPYIYSDILLTEINPEPESLLPADFTQFTLTFDGVVNLGTTTGYDPETGIVMGMGAGNQAFKEVTPASEPVDIEGTVYASSWNLVLPDNYLTHQTTPMLISFKAYDEQGRLVKGNAGKDENSYSIYQYDVPGMYKEITVDLGEEPITSLKEITVSYPTGINVTYEIPFSEVKVVNQLQEEVAVMEDFVMDSDPENPYAIAKSGKIVLNKEITEEGSYALFIPEGFFNLGTEFNDAKNALVTKFFTVIGGGGGTQTVSYTVIPKEGKVTSIPQSLDIFFNDYDEVGMGGGKATLIIDSNEAIELPDAEFGMEFNEMIQGTGTETEYTEEGTYVFSFPAGYFLNPSGNPIPAFTITYTISSEEPEPMIIATFEPAPGEVKNLPAEIRVIFPTKEVVGPGNGKATLSINNGEATYLPDLKIDWEAPENEILQPLGQAYTQDGTYIIHFPAGYFILNDVENSDDMTIIYTLKQNGSGLEAIDVEAKSYTVYTLSGVRILDNADRAAFKALAPGLYIVNGVKVVVK